MNKPDDVTVPQPPVTLQPGVRPAGTFETVNCCWPPIGRLAEAGGYTPWATSAPSFFGDFTLGTHDSTHPLMQGVNTLQAYYDDEMTLSAGATELAKWTDGQSGVVVKGHALGINAYIGGNYQPDHPISGDIAEMTRYARNGLAVRYVAIAAILLAACGSKSPDQKLLDAIEPATSWVATLQFTSEKWLGNSVPTRMLVAYPVTVEAPPLSKWMLPSM